VPRNLDPLNEFTSNDVLFYGAFPIAFPLGCGLRKPGSVPEYDARHMLMQHSRIFAEDSNLIFIMFNQRQRHVVARSLVAKVKASPENFNAFAQIVNAPEFQMRCDEAARDPNGPVAQRLLRDMMPLLRISGGHVPYGPAERAWCISELYAICRCFGLPTFFFTFAPDYTQPQVLRIAISQPKFSGFPAKDEGFIESLCNWDKKGRPENSIFDNTFSVTDTHLRNLVRENGAARAMAYMSMKTAIFMALFGIQEDKLLKKTVPLSSRSPGMFGRARAAYMATECQGCGDLHGHSPIWIELTPDVLQRAADRESLRQVVAEVIDSMTVSSMGLCDHITCVVRNNIMGNRPCRPAWKNNPNRINNAIEFDMLVTTVLTAVQFHSHSDTCKKGKNGRYKCRLCFGRVPAERTRPIELSLLPRENNDNAREGPNERTHALHVDSNITQWTRRQPDWETATLPELDH
jgi:hypothetical protein